MFDIFGLADERAPERREVVEMYGEESRELLRRGATIGAHSLRREPEIDRLEIVRRRRPAERRSRQVTSEQGFAAISY